MLSINNLYKISITSTDYYYINPSSVTFTITAKDYNNNPISINSLQIYSSDTLISYTTNKTTTNITGTNATIKVTNGTATVTMSTSHTENSFATLTIGDETCYVYVEKQATPSFTYNTSASATTYNSSTKKYTAITLSFSAYNDAVANIRVKDEVVSLTGVVTNSKEFYTMDTDGKSTYIKIGTLPTSVIPSRDIYELQQGSNYNKFLLKISHEDGGVYMTRYGATAYNVKVPQIAYLPIDVMYLL